MAEGDRWEQATRSDKARTTLPSIHVSHGSDASSKVMRTGGAYGGIVDAVGGGVVATKKSVCGVGLWMVPCAWKTGLEGRLGMRMCAGRMWDGRGEGGDEEEEDEDEGRERHGGGNGESDCMLN